MPPAETPASRPRATTPSPRTGYRRERRSANNVDQLRSPRRHATTWPAPFKTGDPPRRRPFPPRLVALYDNVVARASTVTRNDNGATAHNRKRSPAIASVNGKVIKHRVQFEERESHARFHDSPGRPRGKLLKLHVTIRESRSNRPRCNHQLPRQLNQPRCPLTWRAFRRLTRSLTASAYHTVVAGNLESGCRSSGDAPVELVRLRRFAA